MFLPTKTNNDNMNLEEKFISPDTIYNYPFKHYISRIRRCKLGVVFCLLMVDLRTNI